MLVTDKKMVLSGWLQKHDEQSYSSSLKLQKFLFLYEAFSRTDGEDADFQDLYGYSMGPVYKTLYECYSNEKVAFNMEAQQKYEDFSEAVDEERAEQIDFVLRILPENELPAFSHKFNIWASQKDRIDSGERNVELDPCDFDAHDLDLTKDLRSLYPLDMVRNSTVIQKPGVSFVLSNSDAAKLTPRQHEILAEIAEGGPGPMGNPMYVEIEPDGYLAID